MHRNLDCDVRVFVIFSFVLLGIRGNRLLLLFCECCVCLFWNRIFLGLCFWRLIFLCSLGIFFCLIFRCRNQRGECWLKSDWGSIPGWGWYRRLTSCRWSQFSFSWLFIVVVHVILFDVWFVWDHRCWWVF